MNTERVTRRLVKAFLAIVAGLLVLSQLVTSGPAASAASSTVASAAASVAIPSASVVANTAVGTVQTKSGGPLTLRAKPNVSSAALKSISSGTKLTILCQTTGSTVTGKYGTSNIWDKTTFGGKTGYVSDTYVYTGSDGRVAPNCGSTTAPPSNSTNVQAVIDAAMSQVGKGYVYSWGAGGKSGPSYGVCCSPSGSDDRQRYGYDCSGLTQYAFWKGAKVDIGDYTGVQVSKGHKVKWASRKPGDLIFWYDSSGVTTHVAIYIGNEKMIESAPPRNGHSVHVTNVYGSHSTVVRIIG